MAAYIHGNLALEERSGKEMKARERRKMVVRKKSLPIQEKLLYLFVMVMCVVVAGLIVWRYAQIYEVNTKIQQIQDQMQQLEEENKQLKVEVLKLQDPKRLLDQAQQLGMAPSSENGIKEVYGQHGSSDKKVALGQ